MGADCLMVKLEHVPSNAIKRGGKLASVSSL